MANDGYSSTTSESIPKRITHIGRSMVRSSWAMAVFGAQQMANMATMAMPGSNDGGGVSGAFDAVTNTMEEQLDGVFRGAFSAGNQAAQKTIDLIDSAEGGAATRDSE